MSKDVPIANWIPEESAASMDQRTIDETPLSSCVSTTAQTQRIWQGMLQARQPWIRLSMHERARRLVSVCEALRREGVGSDTKRLADSTGLSGAGMQAAWDVTFAPWTKNAVADMLQAEGLDAVGATEEALLPRCLVHILAGNVLPPTWSLLMRGWLLGAVQWLRPSSREPLFASSVLRRVSQLDAGLASMTAVTWWPHRLADLDPMAHDVLSQADVVTAHGDDASIAEIEASLHGLPGSRRFLGYGSRWSCAVLGTNDLTRGAADGIAQDVALFDQQGCLSPTRVFVAAEAPVEEWCGWLAQAMAQKQRELPRGEPGPRGRASLRHYLECMRLAQVQEKRRLWAPSSGTAWSVVLTEDIGASESPLDRHVLVHPVRAATELRQSLGSRRQSVQGVALCSVDSEDVWVQEILHSLQPTRVAAVGTLQQAPPAWCQDHLPPLRSLMRDSISES